LKREIQMHQNIFVHSVGFRKVTFVCITWPDSGSPFNMWGVWLTFFKLSPKPCWLQRNPFNIWGVLFRENLNTSILHISTAFKNFPFISMQECWTPLTAHTTCGPRMKPCTERGSCWTSHPGRGAAPSLMLDSPR